MSLAGRFSAFFLAALAVVLGGFSLALYLLASRYLSRSLDERLAAALQTLSAAAEVTPQGVEWEAQHDRLSLGQDADESQVRWLVRDGGGKVLECSRNLARPWPFAAALPSSIGGEMALDAADEAGRSWRLQDRRLDPTPPSMGVPPVAKVSPGDEPKHAAVILSAAVSLQPMHETLQSLGLTLTGLSLGVWLLAALLGRALSHRALLPVARMAGAARAIQPNDLGQRLPNPGTHDALEDLGRAFNDLLGRVQEAFERQRRFTGDASHQLRTPLAVMLGQVEVALRRDRPADEYKRVLEKVAEQGGQLNRLVEMLLFLARADAEAAAPVLQPLRLEPWLQDHLRHWAAHPRAGDIRLIAANETLSARVHEPLLGQVVDILLDNACKYSRPGTPIRVFIRAAGEQTLMVVEDQGIGIDPSDLPLIFDPFFRSPRLESERTVGVGLGLAIARRVTAAMGGVIDAESELGQGSRLVVRLNGG